MSSQDDREIGQYGRRMNYVLSPPNNDCMHTGAANGHRPALLAVRENGGAAGLVQNGAGQQGAQR